MHTGAVHQCCAAAAQHSLCCDCTGVAVLPGNGRHRYNVNSTVITIDSQCMQCTCVSNLFLQSKEYNRGESAAQDEYENLQTCQQRILRWGKKYIMHNVDYPAPTVDMQKTAEGATIVFKNAKYPAL